MATRTPVDLQKVHRAKVWALITKKPVKQQEVNQGIWSWVNGVLGSGLHDIGQALGEFAHGYISFLKFAFPLQRIEASALDRVMVWLGKTELKALRGLLMELTDGLRALIEQRYWQLRHLLVRDLTYLWHQTVLIVSIEARRRQRAVQHAEAQARLEVKALHQLIERQAARAYVPSWNQHLSEAARVADLVAVYNPALRGLVSDVTQGLLDLAAVDDPVARLALGFVIKHIIDRLGIDHVVGDLLQRLAAPILGQPKPRDLGMVIKDLGDRLGALESQWADFMKHGGPEVEQAGDEWRDLASPLVNVSLLALFGLAYADPSAWARDVSGTVGKLVSDTLLAAAGLIKKG